MVRGMVVVVMMDGRVQVSRLRSLMMSGQRGRRDGHAGGVVLN